MPWIKGDVQEKFVFVVLNLILGATWLCFSVRLIAHWGGMMPNIRNEFGVFMVFFLFLWTALIRGRNYVSVLMANMVLAIVGVIAEHLM